MDDEKVKRYKFLLDIGVSLSSETDVDSILNLILEKAMEATGADGASLYLTDKQRASLLNPTDKPEIQVLKFHRSLNRTNGMKTETVVLPLDSKSIAGFVATQGQPVLVEDCYNLSPDLSYTFNRKMDHETGYHTRSMLAVPLKDPEGHIRGVLQLINKLTTKTDGTSDYTAFDESDLELMTAFASQACVTLRNAKLTEDIENLFESFIRASVTAIEARDPATSGHSDRVAVLTVEFARSVHMCTTGSYKNIQFSENQLREIRYASLLHDFGKIGVRESVLSKRLKLYPHEMETIMIRLESVRSKQELLIWKEIAQDLSAQIEKGILSGSVDKLKNAQTQIDDFATQIQQVRLSIVRANQPQVIEADFDIGKLMSWITKASRELEQVIVTPEEMIKLSLPRGTLTREERHEIESHVTHTYHFLKQIAWTEDLSHVPDIAHAHHEKTDGSGYPKGLTGDFIPVQSKLMAITDIYDALTSMDRPYKPAVPPERAIDILHMDARAGKLDIELLKIFIEAGVYLATVGMSNNRKAS